MKEIDISWWTNGFWSGLMWLMYVGTNNEIYKTTAENAEKLLDKAFEEYDKLNHDVGFMWHISSGINYRLFGRKKSKVRTAIAADILTSRYNCEGKYIRAWNSDQTGWVIIDSMMNIPLLYWAAEEYNAPRFKYIAMNHADTIMRTHIRNDGSVNHVVNLDPENGKILETFGGQGYSDGSSWSRGQAWAIYGFILSYIHTGKKEYLETSKKVADYFIECIKTDWLPRIDFRAPDKPVYYDSTAGAIAACGFIEIEKCTGDKKYLDAALKILQAMDIHFCAICSICKTAPSEFL
jgi:unsaturated chondroitin disaccharide hydrolase